MHIESLEPRKNLDAWENVPGKNVPKHFRILKKKNRNQKTTVLLNQSDFVVQRKFGKEKKKKETKKKETKKSLDASWMNTDYNQFLAYYILRIHFIDALGRKVHQIH